MPNNYKKQIFTQKYSAIFAEEFSCATENTPALLTQVLSLLPKESKECLNYKGADSLRPGVNELLFIKGELFESDDKKIKRNFEILHTTPFKEFRGKSDIVFTGKKQVIGVDQDELPIELLPKLFPLEITHLRFGLDLYYPKKYFLFGYHPDVAESILVEWKDQKVRLEIKSKMLEERWDPPLRDSELREKIKILRAIISSQ